MFTYQICEVSKSFRDYFCVMKQMEKDLKFVEEHFVKMDAKLWEHWSTRLNLLRVSYHIVLKYFGQVQ